jgi:hypothetical protein
VKRRKRWGGIFLVFWIFGLTGMEGVAKMQIEWWRPSIAE